ncbi:L10-interacting MYB domain-containing-like protein isoform X1 [Cinnamomum micranthum f. kanehirae]|uniref:L10-interacting MYB domain-containing-like protein isoform X1 n=1 Tax=Cinnamomum micranthum f. kanehirae TaxID=337451 RepID=A0A3S3P5Z4_9MAGN|nr:L10-interacting MYB domain-containing-like protein isoform X1 [Cinnamomum micranthum f. kanehirae]
MDNEICGEDVECINVGTSSGKKRGRREKKNTTWSEAGYEYLADILIEQINLGRKDGTGWTTEGWREIERKMKEKYGSECVKDKIRNRLRTIKQHYNHIKTLMGLSGFGWDDATKRVTASDQVWDDYIKAHPDYDYYRGRSVVNYEKFAIIYGDSIADGRDVLLTNQRPPHPMEAPQANIHDVAGESSSSDKMNEAVSEAPRVKKRSTGSSRRNVQDESKSDYELTHAIKDINTTLIYLADKMAQSGPSQADIVAAIEELDLDLTSEVRALRLLKDPQVASQFLAFSTKDRRHAWLMAELSGSI